jgi:sulfur relay (sulfurtransferase) complex TusBCD TusD component (DsrE family)
MDKRKLGVLLSTPPSHPNVVTVAKLCDEALSAGIDVYLYLIDEGVLSSKNPEYLALVDRGAKFFVCAYGCQQHDVSTNTIDQRVTLCGLVVLSNMIAGCDRFVAFN